MSHEHSGAPTAETPAAVVRAHGLARSSSALPSQWRQALTGRSHGFRDAYNLGKARAGLPRGPAQDHIDGP